MGLRLWSAQRRVPLAADGSFTLEDVPKGRYLLRVVGTEQLLASAFVEADGREPCDLGLLEARHGREAILEVRDAAPDDSERDAGQPVGHLGMWVREAGAWVATLAVRDGKLRLALPAGQYELEPFEPAC